MNTLFGRCGFTVLVLLFVAMVLVNGCNAMRWGHEASEVAYQETRPTVLLKKYRYFKQVAAKLDALQANIAAMDSTLKTWERRYQALPTEKWPRHVSEQYDSRLAETNATKANFNALASDYNQAMSDTAFAFCNVGSLPKGFPEGATALKRKFATYILH